MFNIKVIGIERVNKSRLLGTAIIHIHQVGRVSGIKIINDSGSLKCQGPQRHYYEGGMKITSDVFSFESDLWQEIQTVILDSWRKTNGGKNP